VLYSDCAIRDLLAKVNFELELWKRATHADSCVLRLEAEVARLTRERDEWKTETREYAALSLAPDGMLWRQRCKRAEAEVERLNMTHDTRHRS
jgi:hypothetical protein